MKRRLWIVLAIVAVLLVAGGATGGYLYFQGRQSNEAQSQRCLDMATDFDRKAAQAASSAETARTAALRVGTLQQRQQFLDRAKQYDDLAAEYRDQALKYRELAAR